MHYADMQSTGHLAQKRTFSGGGSVSFAYRASMLRVHDAYNGDHCTIQTQNRFKIRFKKA